jgi:hypothetical protein
MRQMSLGGSAIETPLKTGYEGQPGDHSRVMHMFMSNLTNIAQYMPQGIKRTYSIACSLQPSANG